MELIHVLLGLGWALGLIRADSFQISERAAQVTCTACTIKLGADELQAAPAFAIDTATADEATTYIVITAYKILSDHSLATGCANTTGTQITLPTPYSLVKAAGENPSSFSTSAASEFIDYLGFTACINGASPAVKGLLPQTNSTTSSATSTTPTLTPKTSLSSQSPSASSTVQPLSSAPILSSNSSATTDSSAPQPSKSSLTTSDKIAIGIVIPIVVLSSFLFGLLFLRRYRKRANSGKGTNGISPSQTDTQPYLQQKGELEAEEKRRYELHAQDVRYEVNGEDEIHEVPEHQTRNEHEATEPSAHPSSPRILELRGEECAKELDESEMRTPHVGVQAR